MTRIGPDSGPGDAPALLPPLRPGAVSELAGAPPASPVTSPAGVPLLDGPRPGDGRLLRDLADSAAHRPVSWSGVVTGHERRGPDLAVVRIRPYLPYPFRAGQYAPVQSPRVPDIWRPYSLASAPHPDHIIELHVRAKSVDGLSGALVHRTAVGDPVRLGRAAGGMTLDGDRDLLFVAGDTGVAPFKAMLGELADTGDNRSAVLFWGVRTRHDLYDLDEIEALARACRRATVVPVVSEGEAGPYAIGLVTDAVAAYGEWSAHEAYVSGPPPMVAAAVVVLATLRVPAERIHHDPYA